MKDYYSILGVSPSATFTEIRRAFRKRALELHPDVNNSPSAKEDFIEVHEAHNVLKNIRSRSRYDKLCTSQDNRKSDIDSQQEEKWSNKQKKRSDSGRHRGEKESKKNKKSGSFWGLGDIFAFIVDLLSIFG